MYSKIDFTGMSIGCVLIFLGETPRGWEFNPFILSRGPRRSGRGLLNHRMFIELRGDPSLLHPLKVLYGYIL